MDVVRLDSSSYIPDDLIEGYDSMIWTERFQTHSSFEMQTPLVQETLNLLPEGTFISTLQSEVVMEVETRNIKEDDEGRRVLVVSGREVTSILDSRHVEAPYGKRRKMAKKYSPTGAAAVLIWNVIDNHANKDVTRSNDFPWTSKDKVPNVSVSDSVPVDGTLRNWWLEQGPLWPQLEKIMLDGDLGLRTIRPESGPMTRIAIESALANRGDIIRTVITDVTSLRFDIYKGLDRSHLQSANPKVGFNYIQGHIENDEYLFSKQDLKTACEVMTGVGGDDVYRSGDSGLTGWARRVMSYDGGEPEYPKEKPTYPGKNATNADQTKYEDDLAEWQDKKAEVDAEFLADVQDDALRALKKQRRIKLFSGDISPLAPYVYGTHYKLGDFVTLYGDYNQTERMVVSEYVRTEDAEGDRGYPGLILP